jgi:hypothetical protein
LSGFNLDGKKMLSKKEQRENSADTNPPCYSEYIDGVCDRNYACLICKQRAECIKEAKAKKIAIAEIRKRMLAGITKNEKKR